MFTTSLPQSPSNQPAEASRTDVVRVESLSKAYRIWECPAARLKTPVLDALGRRLAAFPSVSRFLRRKAKQYYHDFHALQDVTFRVRQGESIGIIGKNGSGKSTLFQIIVGTAAPTAGSVFTQGRIAALLELGSGFNPEFTGRENASLNAAILGLSKKEIDACFNEMIAFADIGGYIDQPVKTYSSGMLVRLAFSVAVCTRPDILIVDEALSVGDVFFQQKCFQRIREMLHQGTTLLFVSHDTGAVQNLCDQAVVLDGGRAVFVGPPEEAASRYFALANNKSTRFQLADEIVETDQEDQSTGEPPERLAALKNGIFEHNCLESARSRHGAQDLVIAGASFTNDAGFPSMTVEMMRTATIRLLLRARADIRQPSAGIHIYDRMNNLIFASGTRQLQVPMPPLKAGQERILTFRIEMSLQPGLYTFSLSCSEPSSTGVNHGYLHDRHEGLGPVRVVHPPDAPWPFFGAARLPMYVSVNG